ncbi:predicted protein [Naegleria gruberi]|uniref:Predicted protein n=1 Tax=Naegleria gruberi TaxID=5762 RepID=D2V999_NAEGR|nr:uncharacterized protein NAEGRDRAFT_65614 [Naegleria gruberi]EFC46554.1 predicted protein [Naegleria gruberi]|eukprot:XP_002679298.1 predicted protein [Naegleria gruberi strain NEG-M]
MEFSVEDYMGELYDFYPDYWDEGQHGYWGIVNGFQSGTIFFNDNTTKLDTLNPSSNFMCAVRYIVSNKPSNEIAAKDCLYSSKQLDIFSATASSFGIYVTVRNLGRDYDSVRLGLNPERLGSGVHVVHSIVDNFIAWRGLTNLVDDTFIVVGNAQCSHSQQNTDRLTFADESLLILPPQCDMVPFAALFTSPNSMTLRKRQVLQQGGTGGSFINKVVKSSASSFWIGVRGIRGSYFQTII